jgi:hypothetical protein
VSIWSRLLGRTDDAPAPVGADVITFLGAGKRGAEFQDTALIEALGDYGEDNLAEMVRHGLNSEQRTAIGSRVAEYVLQPDPARSDGSGHTITKALAKGAVDVLDRPRPLARDRRKPGAAQRDRERQDRAFRGLLAQAAKLPKGGPPTRKLPRCIEIPAPPADLRTRSTKDVFRAFAEGLQESGVLAGFEYLPSTPMFVHRVGPWTQKIEVKSGSSYNQAGHSVDVNLRVWVENKALRQFLANRPGDPQFRGLMLALNSDNKAPREERRMDPIGLGWPVSLQRGIAFLVYETLPFLEALLADDWLTSLESIDRLDWLWPAEAICVLAANGERQKIERYAAWLERTNPDVLKNLRAAAQGAAIPKGQRDGWLFEALREHDLVDWLA